MFGHLTWRQHANLRSLGFDTGIYDQGMWLLAHGRDPFLTMRGMDYCGHHVADSAARTSTSWPDWLAAVASRWCSTREVSPWPVAP